MKVKFIILILFIAVVFQSCISRYLATDLTPKSGNIVTILNPASSIELVPINKGNSSMFSDSLTLIANRNLTEGLNQYLSAYFQVTNLEFSDATNEILDFHLYQMFNKLKSQRKIDRVPIPPTLDSIMDIHNIDYAICTLHLGFCRDIGNYLSVEAKGYLITILSLGTNNAVPKKPASKLAICIVDGDSHQIAFHNRSYLRGLDPTQKTITDHQIERIFKKYFRKLNY